MNLWIVFLTGLTIGGLTCLVVQGGLLASVIASRKKLELSEKTSKSSTLFAIAAFLTSKLFAYIILGFILGALGKTLAFSDRAQIIIQALAGVYMVGVALNLLNIHPIFKYFIIQPPRFLSKLVRKEAKSTEVFAPALLGLLTVFIPCGTTLAMEALALSSGSSINGALVMGVFVLGTMPLFFGLGFTAATLGNFFREKFLKFAAFAILYLGITSINGSLVAVGSPISLQTLKELIPVEINLDDSVASNSQVRVEEGVQIADIAVLVNGYSPQYIQVHSNQPVKLNLTTDKTLGCTAGFRIPKLGVSKTLSSSSTDSVEFTPIEKGKLTWTCAMGMYTGVIEVI